jgi:hypothetical protein
MIRLPFWFGQSFNPIDQTKEIKEIGLSKPGDELQTRRGAICIVSLLPFLLNGRNIPFVRLSAYVVSDALPSQKLWAAC